MQMLVSRIKIARRSLERRDAEFLFLLNTDCTDSTDYCWALVSFVRYVLMGYSPEYSTSATCQYIYMKIYIRVWVWACYYYIAPTPSRIKGFFYYGGTMWQQWGRTSSMIFLKGGWLLRLSWGTRRVQKVNTRR